MNVIAIEKNKAGKGNMEHCDGAVFNGIDIGEMITFEQRLDQVRELWEYLGKGNSNVLKWTVSSI